MLRSDNVNIEDEKMSIYVDGLSNTIRILLLAFGREYNVITWLWKI